MKWVSLPFDLKFTTRCNPKKSGVIAWMEKQTKQDYFRFSATSEGWIMYENHLIFCPLTVELLLQNNADAKDDSLSAAVRVGNKR